MTRYVERRGRNAIISIVAVSIAAVAYWLGKMMGIWG